MSNKPKTFREAEKKDKFSSNMHGTTPKKKAGKLALQIVVGALAVILAIMFSVPAILLH